MKFSLKAETPRDVLLHALIAVFSAFNLILFFFYVWLPYTTRHGQTITVPDLKGKKLDEIEEILSDKNLEFAIDDSTYQPDVPHSLVYNQYPLAGSLVKQGRKIFVSITSRMPPQVRMPNLVNRSVINAQSELEGYGLKLGQITYVPDLQQNSVLKQMINGKEIPEGAYISKGAAVDLVVGDGLGNQEFNVPTLVGMAKDEAELTLSGSGLQVGAIVYQPESSEPPGVILRQKPSAGAKIRSGDVVDIWVAGPDPTSLSEEPLDETE